MAPKAKSTKILFIFLSLLLGSFPALSQGDNLTTKRAIWVSRAETITDRLVKQTFKSDDLEKAILFSKLGNLWWPSDKAKSKIFFEKSVDTLFFYSSEEIKNNNLAYLQTVRQILKIIASKSPKQTSRLISILSDSEKVLAPNNGFSADTLMDFALSIVKDDSLRAAELGILSFRLGQPAKFFQLYWELRKIDSRSADRLLRTAMQSAQDSPSAQIASNLKNAVFPEINFPNAPESVRSSSLQKIEALKFLSDFVFQQQNKFINKLIGSCANEAGIVAPLQGQFASLLPDRLPAVAQSISVCVSGGSSPSSGEANGTDSAEANTVEGLIKLADNSKDNLERRTYYLFRAVSLANDQKLYRIATEILENMSGEEQAIDREFWDTLRYTVASGYAFQQLKENDLSGAMKTLDRVPLNTRAFAKIGLALKCAPKDTVTREFCVSVIDDAMTDFAKTDKSSSEKYGFWLKAVKIYSDYGQNRSANSAFEAIAKEFNKDIADKKTADFHITSEAVMSVITADFLESHDQSLLQSADLLADQTSKTNTNLAFLSVALKRVEELSKLITENGKIKKV
ncbi:MAG: hypothetical protein ACR2IH_06245 [Pyrinomonadaceae bacterium]